jgi:hypothetical protein
MIRILAFRNSAIGLSALVAVWLCSPSACKKILAYPNAQGGTVEFFSEVLVTMCFAIVAVVPLLCPPFASSVRSVSPYFRT